jgi:hypothetical protein
MKPVDQKSNKHKVPTTITRIQVDDHTTISLMRIHSKTSGSLIEVLHNLLDYLRWHTDAPRGKDENVLMAQELDKIINKRGRH